MVVGGGRLKYQKRSLFFLMDFEDFFVSGVGVETVDSHNMNEE